MFDTHAIARALTDAGISSGHADAITNAVRQAAEHDPAGLDTGALATKADIAALKTDVAALEARIYRAMLVQAGAIVGAVIAILRFLD